MKKLVVVLFVVLLLASVVIAARWIGPLETSYRWDKKEYGFCGRSDQCFVSASPNAKEEHNDDPSKYFTDPPGPRCIAGGQFILDKYCMNGKWTTRTALVGLAMLDFAGTAGNDFVLFCDKYENALNQYKYIVGQAPNTKLAKDLLENSYCRQYGTTISRDCVNHVCVLDYQGGTGLGVSLNMNITDEDYSFLLALEGPLASCNNVASTEDNFRKCNNWNKPGSLFYNPKINSLIYLSTDESSLPNSDYSTTFNVFIDNEFGGIETYVMDEVNDPGTSSLNFSFFKETGLYNRWLYSQQANKRIFAFLETDQTEFDYDYIGIKYENINLGDDPCENIFKHYSARGTYCEGQSGNEFFVVSKGSSNSQSNLVGAWLDLTGKLRPK